MKSQFLKLAGVKDEKSFYKLFPDEKSFMAKYGKQIKKAWPGIDVPEDPRYGYNSDYMAEDVYPYQGENVFNPAVLNGTFPQMKGLKTPDMSSVKGMPKQLGYNLSGNATGKQMDMSGNPLTGLSSQQNITSQGAAVAGKAGGLGDLLGQVGGMQDLPGKIVEGVKGIIEEKKKMYRTQKWDKVSDIVRQASGMDDVDANQQLHNNMAKKREMMMPVTSAQNFGVGTNPLAKYGKNVKGKRAKGEIMNVYNSPDIPRAAGGFETFLDAGGANLIGNTTAQIYGDNAGSKLGGDLGSTAGTLIGGPVGSLVGSELGKLAGFALDSYGRKTEKYQDSMNNNIGMIGMNNGMKGVRQQYTSYMEDGGDVNPQVLKYFGDNRLSDLLRDDPTMNTLRTGGTLRQNTPDMQMNGELQTHWGGHAEPISYNPYLPDNGEMVQFKGNSHEESENGRTGIGMTFGNSPVEVEGGEPAVKLSDGGTTGDSLTVFGNMKIGKQGASLIGDPNAANLKFKNYTKDLASKTSRVNSLIDKSTEKVNDLQPVTSFDKLSLNSLHANIMGSQMKLKDYADKTQKAADYQQAINDYAEENNLIADELAKGKIKQAKQGTRITSGTPDRKSWDVIGKAADWAGEKIGQAYQEYVPQGVKDVIEPVGEFASRVNEWPFTPEYRAEHPINAGVAPGVGIVGKATKAAKAAKAMTEAERVAKEAEAAAKLASSIKREKFIQKAINDITLENINDPAIVARMKDLPQDHLEVLNDKILEMQSLGRKTKDLQTIEIAEAQAFPKSKYKGSKTSKETVETIGGDKSGWGWPAVGLGLFGAGATGAIGKGVYDAFNSGTIGNTSIEELNRIAPPSQVPGQMNPLYNAMKKNYQYGGIIPKADGGVDNLPTSTTYQPPWKTTPVYLPWNMAQPQVMSDNTLGDKMTPQQIVKSQRPVSKKPLVPPKLFTDHPELMPKFDEQISTEYTRDNLLQDIGESPTVNKIYNDNNVTSESPSKKNDKFWWVNALNSMIPQFRPSDAEELDPRQLSGEMYAMANNQLEPVQAQTYQPRLRDYYDISMQDQLNEVHAQTRAAQQMAGYNPAAQAAIAAQAYGPESKILAEQFRANQAMKDQVATQNLATLNDAQLKNLGIFDQQYQRQAGAKSNTKATTQSVLNSISAKYLQNQSEQRQLQTMENMYGYRFGPGMKAQNWNGLAQFNTEGNNTNKSNSSGIIRNEKGEELLPVMDKSGDVVRYIVKDTTSKSKSKNNRNGSIVHAYKNL
jgi:hypothetical protein